MFDLLIQIDRPDTRAVFARILADNKQLRAEIDIMRKFLKKGESRLIIDRRQKEVQPSQGQIAHLPPFKNLHESEIKALRNSISDQFFADQGWTAQDNGRVINSRGRSIYNAGYVTAIKKILSFIENDASQSWHN